MSNPFKNLKRGAKKVLSVAQKILRGKKSSKSSSVDESKSNVSESNVSESNVSESNVSESNVSESNVSKKIDVSDTPIDLTSTNSSLYAIRKNIENEGLDWSSVNTNTNWKIVFNKNKKGSEAKLPSTMKNSYREGKPFGDKIKNNIKKSDGNNISVEGHYVQIDIGAKAIVKTFEYIPRKKNTEFSWKKLRLVASNNKKDFWYDIWSKSDRIQRGTSPETYTITWPENIPPCQYFRWICEENHGGMNAWNAMEMTLKGNIISATTGYI